MTGHSSIGGSEHPSTGAVSETLCEWPTIRPELSPPDLRLASETRTTRVPLPVQNGHASGIFCRWLIPLRAGPLFRPWQTQYSLRGTLPLFASRIGSLPYPSWPCSSAGWKFSSLTRAFIGDRQRRDSSLIHTADSSLPSHRPHRLRLRASRPERLEPLSPFSIFLARGLYRPTLR